MVSTVAKLKPSLSQAAAAEGAAEPAPAEAPAEAPRSHAKEAKEKRKQADGGDHDKEGKRRKKEKTQVEKEPKSHPNPDVAPAATPWQVGAHMMHPGLPHPQFVRPMMPPPHMLPSGMMFPGYMMPPPPVPPCHMSYPGPPGFFSQNQAEMPMNTPQTMAPETTPPAPPAAPVLEADSPTMTKKAEEPDATMAEVPQEPEELPESEAPHQECHEPEVPPEEYEECPQDAEEPRPRHVPPRADLVRTNSEGRSMRSGPAQQDPRPKVMNLVPKPKPGRPIPLRALLKPGSWRPAGSVGPRIPRPVLRMDLEDRRPRPPSFPPPPPPPLPPPAEPPVEIESDKEDDMQGDMESDEGELEVIMEETECGGTYNATYKSETYGDPDQEWGSEAGSVEDESWGTWGNDGWADFYGQDQAQHSQSWNKKLGVLFRKIHIYVQETIMPFRPEVQLGIHKHERIFQPCRL